MPARGERVNNGVRVDFRELIRRWRDGEELRAKRREWKCTMSWRRARKKRRSSICWDKIMRLSRSLILWADNSTKAKCKSNNLGALQPARISLPQLPTPPNSTKPTTSIQLLASPRTTLSFTPTQNPLRGWPIHNQTEKKTHLTSITRAREMQ